MDTDKILICDTLNNKIKCVEVDGTRSAYSKSFIGSGKRGNNLIVNKGKDKDDKDKDTDEALLKNIELNSPQGVAYDRNKKIIYIADTGNNRILSVNRITSAIKEMKFDFSNI